MQDQRKALMSNAARKARKKAGIKFERKEKVATGETPRSWRHLKAISKRDRARTHTEDAANG